MNHMLQKKVRIGRTLLTVGGVLLFYTLTQCELLAQAGGGGARRGRSARTSQRNIQDQAQQVTDAAAAVKDIADRILRDYVAQNIPLESQDVADIREIIKGHARYQGRFEKEERACLMLIDAYLAHYDGDVGKDVINFVQRARRSDPENVDISDTLVVLALLHEDYATAQKIMAERNAGEAIALGPLPKTNVNARARNASSTNGGDPNTNPAPVAVAAAAPTPQSKWAQPAGNQNGATRGIRGGRGVSPNLAFSQNGPRGSGPPPGRFQPPPGRPGIPPGSTAARSAAGPGAPRAVPQRGRRGGRQTASSRRAAGNRRSTSRSAGILNLPLDYMPYEYLGKDFRSLNVRNLNGTFYQYDPDRGQMLAILLWTLPQGDQLAPSRRGRGGRTGRFTRQVNPNVVEIPQPGFDLDTNLTQFRELYRTHSGSAKLDFVTANLDAPTAANRNIITDLFIEQSWPWANFAAYEPANQGQWPAAARVRQAMMLVDTQGIIRYMGPVGGFLPLILIDAGLPEATAATGGFPNQAAPPPRAMPTQATAATGSPGGGFYSRFFGPAVKVNSPAPTTNPRQNAQPLRSEPQAQNMLQTARVQRRFPRSALRAYDQVLERFPDTLEAEQARLQIKRILHKNNRLKKEREKQGKYTG